MSTILDEPAVRRAAFPVSVEFYHELGRLGHLDQAVELLDGVIIRKMSKSPLHVFVLHRLRRLIATVLTARQQLRHESPITTATSEPEPDLAVVEGGENDFFDRHPTTALLVVEVAVSSVEIDRRKAAIYADAGVKEYWLVEPEAARITVFRQPVSGRYESEQVFADGAVLACDVLPGLSIGLAELFKR